MKQMHKIVMAVLTMAAVLSLSVSVFAATTQKSDTADSSSAAKTEQSTAEADKDAAADSSDSTAYQEALDAYRKAKSESRTKELEEELNQMVKDGKLTKEQADLLLKQEKDQESLAQGVCPNCGYEFSTQGGHHGGKGRGGRGRLGFNGMEEDMTGMASGTGDEAWAEGAAGAIEGAPGVDNAAGVSPMMYQFDMYDESI